jgi:hypothetical protein
MPIWAMKKNNPLPTPTPVMGFPVKPLKIPSALLKLKYPEAGTQALSLLWYQSVKAWLKGWKM